MLQAGVGEVENLFSRENLAAAAARDKGEPLVNFNQVK